MPEHRIPIRNLYYLLCYAWDRLDQGSLIDVSRVESTELVDLFAVVLVQGIEHLARRGLERGYRPQQAELRGVRGRIDVYLTERRLLRHHGRAACIYDELTSDTLANRIIKSTLRSLVRNRNISKENREGVARVIRQLQGVEEIAISHQSFRKVQLGANSRFYRFLLNVCELIHGSWMAEESEGSNRFREFIRDEKKMALVFQEFVYNFLRIERKDLSVYRENIAWKAGSESEEDLSLLPNMQTDVSVQIGSRKIIIETKYYRETLSDHFGSEKLHAENLYQLFSYLANAHVPGKNLEGVLLYPAVGRDLDARYSILGMPVRVMTLDLSQSWELIHQHLMQVLN